MRSVRASVPFGRDRERRIRRGGVQRLDEGEVSGNRTGRRLRYLRRGVSRRARTVTLAAMSSRSLEDTAGDPGSREDFRFRRKFQELGGIPFGREAFGEKLERGNRVEAGYPGPRVID